tara:strand:- start:92 stop:2548 length:2457 start_codon:yes stop_codon:yes gene_type:complete
MANKSRRTGNLVSNDNIFVDVTNDRVGIGSTVPKAGFALDVAGIISATGYRGDGSQLTGVSGSGGITGINTLATSHFNHLDVTGVSTFGSGSTGITTISDDGTVIIGAAATIKTLTVGNATGVGGGIGDGTISVLGDIGASITVGSNIDGTGQNHLGVQYTTGGPGQIFTSNGNLRFVVDGGGAGSVPLIQQAGFEFGSNGNFSNDAEVVINAVDANAGVSTALLVRGDIRATGIVTVGESSITLDGTNNQVVIGTGVTLSSTQINVGSGVTITSTSIIADSISAAFSSWTLGAVGSSHYTFTGPGLIGAESDPELYLIRGQKYNFINNMGIHPFRIQSDPNGSSGAQYNDGITNNDVTNGTLVWDVQFDSPNTLYYQCTSHGAMGGKINIIDQSAGSDKIEEGNTLAEVVDTGTDGHFKVQTEGVERLRVGAAGSVGIGTDDPDSTLHIDGELRISNGTEDNIIRTTTDGKFFFGDSALAIDDANGNVGIGTTIPAGDLQVGTGVTVFGDVGIVSATEFRGSGSNLTGLTGAAANTYGNATSVAQLTVDANGRISNIQNVSISVPGGGGTGSNLVEVRHDDSVVGSAGTINFAANLDVTPLSVGVVTVTATDTNTTYTLPASDAGSGNVNLTLTGSDSSTDTVLITAGSNVTFSGVTAGGFTINSSGGGGGGGTGIGGTWAVTNAGIHTTKNVGIGTTNPQTSLQVGKYGVHYGSGTFTAAAGVLSNLDNFTVADDNFLTAEYTLHIINDSGTQVSKALVMQDGTTADSQEFAIMFSDSLLVSVGSSIHNGDCHLSVTPQTGITGLTTYRFTRQTML